MNRRSVHVGVLAGAVLAAFYAFVVAAASGSMEHLADQTADDWYLLVPIVAGFGVQAALLTELRQRHRLHAQAMATGSASAGASAAGMVACCAHHLADLVPLLGATGIAAFLTDWRTAFMLVGISVNAIGIAIAARRLRNLPNTPQGDVACAHA